MKLNVERKLLDDLEKLPSKDWVLIRSKLREFEKTGKGDTRKIRDGLFRLRIGRWRIFYWQEKDEAYILKILPREVAYRLDVIDEMIRRIARLRMRKKGQI